MGLKIQLDWERINQQNKNVIAAFRLKKNGNSPNIVFKIKISKWVIEWMKVSFLALNIVQTSVSLVWCLEDFHTCSLLLGLLQQNLAQVHQ